MWTMWFYYYTNFEQLYTVYSNLGVYNNDSRSCLCINRREVGLHFTKKGNESLCNLLENWREDFVKFPADDDIIRLDWDGRVLSRGFF